MLDGRVFDKQCFIKNKMIILIFARCVNPTSLKNSKNVSFGDVGLFFCFDLIEIERYLCGGLPQSEPG